jgi:hypothetical protein
MLRVAALALLVTSACGNARAVTVQVVVPDLDGAETPIPGVEVAALPYDRDSVLAVLERHAASGRPRTKTLDSLFQAFRTPFMAFARLAWQVERATRARATLAGQRAAAAPGSPGAEELDRRLRTLDDSLLHLAPALERARTELAAARDTLWPRIEPLRDAAREWEHTTYAGYDTIVRTLTRDRMRNAVADTTGATGWADFRLPRGDWWIYARPIRRIRISPGTGTCRSPATPCA